MIPTNFNDAVRSGFAPYMAESLGYDNLVTTRTAKINAIIKDFKYLVRQGKNPNEYIYEVLAKHGLNENLLTDAEIRKINGAINGT